MIIKAVLSPEKNEKKIELLENSTALDMLKNLDLNPDVMIVIRNEVPIPVDEKLKDKDVLNIIRVVSGGWISIGVAPLFSTNLLCKFVDLG